MFDDNKNDTTLTDTKSTKSDRKRSKREDHDYYEAEEYDGQRPWYFTLFSNKEDAEKWVSQNPSIRKCRKFIHGCGALNIVETQ